MWGPASVASPEGFKYYILFEDNYSRFCWLYPMKLKSEATQIFLNFKKTAENLTNYKIKILQANWRGEYKPLKSILVNFGILF